MKTIICLFFIVLSAQTLQAQKASVIKGQLYDEQSKAPVAYANVVVKNSFMGTSSGENGFFEILLPPGDYVLQIYHVVYYPKEISLTVKPDSGITLSVYLQEKTEQLGMITVQGQSWQAPSQFVLKPFSIINAPAVGEPDLVRTAAMLPGITMVNDYRSELNIRGGHTDQNQFLLDGIEVFYPQHVMGMFSAFNIWALEDIDIYSARFPAQFSGRLSGVIALKTKIPTIKTYAKANISLISSGIALSRKWKTTGVLFAARRTYLDLITGLFGTKFPYNFYDLNLKVEQALWNDWHITASVYFNTDKQDIDQAYSDWGNRVGSVKLCKKTTDYKKFLTAYYSAFYSEAGDAALSSSFIRNNLSISGLSYNYEKLFSKSYLKAGLAYKNYRVDYNWFLEEPINPGTIFYPGAPPVYAHSQSLSLIEAWFGTDLLYLPRFPLSFKLRYHLKDIKQAYIAQGFHLDWNVSHRLTLTTGAERVYQFIAAGAQALELSAPSPLFITDKPIAVDQYTVGGVYKFDLNFQIKSELYYKRFHSFTRLDIDAVAYPSFEYGKAYAYGAELSLEKLRGRITFQLSYSYLNAMLRFDGPDYKPAWDVPHAFKGLLGFRFGRTWLFNAAFIYRSGNLYKNAEAMFYAAGSAADHEYSRTDYDHISRHFIKEPFATTRFEPYTRLDLALRKKYQAKYFNWTLYIQVQNITWADNPLRIDYRERYGTGHAYSDGGITMSIPILPSVGAEFEF